MALPLLFIGAAVATGAVGGTKTIKAVSDNSRQKLVSDGQTTPSPMRTVRSIMYVLQVSGVTITVRPARPLPIGT